VNVRDLFAKKTFSETSVTSPSVAVFGMRAYMTWRGDQNSENLNLAIIDVDLSNSDDAIRNATVHAKVTFSDTSAAAPSVAAFNGRLYIAWTGLNNSVNIANIELNDKGIFSIVNAIRYQNQTSFTGPAIAGHGDRIYVCWCGEDDAHSLNLAEFDTDLRFLRWNQLAERSHQTPALLSSYAYEGTADRHASLTLAWTGTDGRLNIALINFDHLDVKSGTKDTYDQFSDSSPSLAYWGGQYIAWTGTFGPPFINIAAISKYNAELSPPAFQPLSPETYVEQALGGLSLVPLFPLSADGTQDVLNEPARLMVFWAGVDGAGLLNMGVAEELGVSP
jgi:hypothetical protein